MSKELAHFKSPVSKDYASILGDISNVIEIARKSAARSVNSIMTAAYWLIGRRIVEFEQGGKTRAEYGEAVLQNLSADLTKQYGRGYSRQNLQQMRQFYLLYPSEKICQTVSGKLVNNFYDAKCQTVSGRSETQKQKYATLSRITPAGKTGILQTVSAESFLSDLAKNFPLPWSAYVRLLAVNNEYGRKFYESEALRGGWSVRQLDRQIDSQFYERTALSKNKAAMLVKGQKKLPKDRLSPEEEIKDPFVLEFLNLKDEYSETELEEALIRHLETFLLELGGDFCFVGRQKRLRIDDQWYRVDLVFFHRRLRCLVIIDLKLGKFTHADAGQMHLYLNYAREHWVRDGENPAVGLILCAEKDEAVARYALEGLPNKVMAAEYRTALPDEKKLCDEIERTQAILRGRK